MTENKPIMIDGVDVSKCSNFDNDECINPSETVSACESSPACLFKQLARKTQELEQLEAEKELYKTWYRAKHGDVKDYLGNLNAEKKQAEQKLKRIREFATALCYTVMSDGVVTLQKDILQIIDEVE